MARDGEWLARAWAEERKHDRRLPEDVGENVPAGAPGGTGQRGNPIQNILGTTANTPDATQTRSKLPQSRKRPYRTACTLPSGAAMPRELSALG